MVPEMLDIETPAAGVLLIRFNRPKRLNAINEVMRDELARTLASVANDASRARGGASPVPGADSARVSTSATSAPACWRPPPPPSTGCASRRRWRDWCARLADLPQAVIAAINGPCVGAGLALSLAADIRIASTAATFGNAAILLGLSGAEMGMSYHLPRIVGAGVAADWMLTGRTVSAEEADRRGLVSQLVEPEQLSGAGT